MERQKDARASGETVNELGFCDGQVLREMFAAGMTWLEKSVPDINALNVFPVPDGDCGTNMLLTMQATVKEAYRAVDGNASGVAQAMARRKWISSVGGSLVLIIR